MNRHVLPWLAALLLSAVTSTGIAAPGVTDTTVVLGQSAPLTGPASQQGIEMRDGALAYFDYVNSKGGVAGRKIILKTRDDAADTARAASNTRQFIEEDGVFALFGYVGIEPAKAALPLVDKENLPFFAPLTGGAFLHTQFRPNVFNIRAGNALEGEKIAENMQSMRFKKIAVLHSDDAGGKAAYEEFARSLRKYGMSVMGTATIARNSTNVAAAVATIRAMEPHAVMVIATYPSSAAFIQAMRKDALSIPFFWNMSFVGSQGLSKALGRDAAGVMISQVMPSPWNARMALIQQYRQLYLSQPGRQPGFSSVEGFIAAKAFVQGLERAGTHLTRARFKAALESAKSMDLGGFMLQFSPTRHEASQYVELTVIGHDGTFLY